MKVRRNFIYYTFCLALKYFNAGGRSWLFPLIWSCVEGEWRGVFFYKKLGTHFFWTVPPPPPSTEQEALQRGEAPLGFIKCTLLDYMET